MTCRKCSHEFCWLCGGNYSTHTNCGAWKDGPTSEERQSIQKYMDAVFCRRSFQDSLTELEQEMRP